LTNRWDETWHRLRDWTNGQAPSERLAAQILLHEGYKGLDPSHPLGGKDGKKDAVCQKDGQQWLMAVYFPRGQQSFKVIKKKFLDDLKGVEFNKADALAFVTNQKISLANRDVLTSAGKVPIELFHLERITVILDKPEMVGVRKQFLGIDYDEANLVLLGGEGGKDFSAGGGGGGALGFGAQGGDGGPGGNIILDGHPGEVPGAGGGGGGAIGDEAIGGEGGGGGECVTATFRIEDLPANVLEITVGRGGRGGENGGDGEDGSDTTIRCGNDILLQAKGGKRGRRGGALEITQPASQLFPTSEIRISSAFFANYAEVREGLINTLGCGWDSYIVQDFPTIMQGSFVFVIDMNEVTLCTKYELLFELLDSGHHVVVEVPVSFNIQTPRKIIRTPSVILFQCEVFPPGIWVGRVLLGSDELVRVAFEVKLAQ